MTTNPRDRIEDIDARLKELPKGTLTYKTINGKKQPYIQKSVDGKVTSTYVKLDEREQVLLEFEERSRLQEEKKHLLAYMRKLQKILSRNPYLDARVGIGFQDFGDYACGKQFYVDKTHFISEWLRSNVAVTLINRPRRFGKTMLLRAISGLIVPSSGVVYVDGKALGTEISFPPEIGILIEKPEFLGHLSGFENLKMLSEIKGSISDANIAEYMNYFDLDPEEKKPARKYSQGMKQKLGIIQAIMENQKLLVLDEPFNALDEKSVKLFRELLIEYKKQEKLIILTSHNKEDIESLCDHTYQIQSGQIIAE